MNNPYLAHFGAQIASTHFGAVPPGITDLISELEGWLEFVKGGTSNPHATGAAAAFRQGLSPEDNEHNQFTYTPTTSDSSFDLGAGEHPVLGRPNAPEEALTSSQIRAVKSLFAEAARVATKIEDYNTAQNKVASFKAGPGAGATATSDVEAQFTVPGFGEEKFPCGYYVTLDYEAMVPRYRSSRYQQRFLVVLLGLLSHAVQVKHGFALDSSRTSRPSYVRFMTYGLHLTQDTGGLPDARSFPDPGLTVHNTAMRQVLAGLYSHAEAPREGEEENHHDDAGPSLYRALTSFVRRNLYPWVTCPMPIKLGFTTERIGFPWVLNENYFGTDTGASLQIVENVPADKRDESCADISDLPIPEIALTGLPTTERRAALAGPLPGPGTAHKPGTRATLCRPFGATPTSSAALVEMAPTVRSDVPLTAPEEAAIEEVRTARRDVEREVHITPAPAQPAATASPYTPEPAPSAAPSAAPPPPPRGGVLARRRRQQEEEAIAEQVRRTPGERIEEMSMKQLMVATALVGAGATLVGVMLTRPRND